MPSYIVKPDAAEDFYVLWSDNVDAPSAWGPRAYLEGLRGYGHDPAPQRFERADQAGSSALWGDPADPIYGYKDDTFIYEQRGVLPRGRLKEACERLGKDPKDPITDLLVPFEDEEEVRQP